MRPQPRVGWFFPVTPGAFARATRNWPFGDREPRLLRNPERPEAARQPLVELRPGLDVTVFSLPVGVDAELGERAALRALQEVARWKDDPPVNPRDQHRAIVVYLEGATLRVIDHRVKLSRRKFGSGEGLATSSKPRVSRRERVELGVLSLE